MTPGRLTTRVATPAGAAAPYRRAADMERFLAGARRVGQQRGARLAL